MGANTTDMQTIRRKMAQGKPLDPDERDAVIKYRSDVEIKSKRDNHFRWKRDAADSHPDYFKTAEASEATLEKQIAAGFMACPFCLRMIDPKQGKPCFTAPPFRMPQDFFRMPRCPAWS
jgi:hypothetical protein